MHDMKLFQNYNMFSKDISDKRRMSDPYFTLNLDKDGKDYIAKNGERLQFK
jgi:hypothetical protein